MATSPIPVRRVDFILPILLPGPRSKRAHSVFGDDGGRKGKQSADELWLLQDLAMIQIYVGDEHTEIPLVAVRQLWLLLDGK